MNGIVSMNSENVSFTTFNISGIPAMSSLIITCNGTDLMTRAPIFCGL